MVDADEAVADEIVDVRVAERAGELSWAVMKKFSDRAGPQRRGACGGRQFSRGRGAPGSKRAASNDLEEGRSDREHHHVAGSITHRPGRLNPSAWARWARSIIMFFKK
ncbi:hypothetical protein OV079_46205 [Nannocystis pusilla]|uniref:Uncharacterized protein n=1 Tax=Nannocystis pusilla TaxID=889268 RepID=A0A9X3F076_9BACT|nr:hypothetical protein [Nannocystis pusilla]MCY1012810.1 hypothetical protein [Nannocystis pusilla]